MDFSIRIQVLANYLFTGRNFVTTLIIVVTNLLLLLTIVVVVIVNVVVVLEGELVGGVVAGVAIFIV